MNTKQNKIRKMVTIALFGALAGLIQAFEFPVPFLPPFYSLDFSWVIVILGGFLLGPFSAVGIELLKVLIFFLLHGTQSAFVGELAIFIMGVSFTLPVCLIYKNKPSFKSVLIGLIISIVSVCIVAALTNYYLLLPAYSSGLGFPMESIIAIGTQLNSNVNSLLGFVLLMTIPFNLLKGGLSAVLVALIYPRFSKLKK